MEYLLLAAGFVLLVKGGEWLVGGAAELAASLKIPPVVIGVVILGFGTSSPELFTSVNAALVGAPGLSVGNVVGSNIANTLLILGAAAMVAPFAVRRRRFWIDGGAAALAAGCAAAAVLAGVIDRWFGAGLLAVLIAYLAFCLYRPLPDVPKAPNSFADIPDAPPKPQFSWLKLVVGLAATLLGAALLVEGAVGLARSWGVTEAMIGLTVVAIGTSLPELAIVLIAGRKGETELAFGNVVGSNIFNVFGILGVTAMVTPIATPPEIAQFDIWALIAATGLVAVLAITHWRVTRLEGALLLTAYAAYMAAKIVPVL